MYTGGADSAPPTILIVVAQKLMKFFLSNFLTFPNYVFQVQKKKNRPPLPPHRTAVSGLKSCIPEENLHSKKKAHARRVSS